MSESITFLQLNLALLYFAGALFSALWITLRGPILECNHLKLSEMLACMIWPLYILAYLPRLIVLALRNRTGGRR